MSATQLSTITLLALSLAACGTDNAATDTGSAGTTPVEGVTLRWSFEGLETLGDGYVYEGWIIVEGAPVSTGRFNLDANGAPELDAFELTDEQVSGAEAFVLSIEPEVGDDPAPAPTKVLGGDLASDGSTTLSIAHGAALGTDLHSAAGGFILETPTTASVADDHDLGVWFLDPALGPGAALDLPTLPEGWVYEGWLVTDGPISTGRFTAVDATDSDGAGPYAGPDAAPPFPGSDFIDPAMSADGAAVVISIEPEPDDSAAPFALKPLIAMGVVDPGPGVLVDLTNQTMSNNPTGSVWME